MSGRSCDSDAMSLEDKFPFLRDEAGHKRARQLLTPDQTKVLRKILAQTPFPSTSVREAAARELGITPRKVQVWFQNVRQKEKKRTLSAACDLTSLRTAGNQEEPVVSASASSSTAHWRQRSNSHPHSIRAPELSPLRQQHAISQSTRMSPYNADHRKRRNTVNTWNSPPPLLNMYTDNLASAVHAYLPRALPAEAPAVVGTGHYQGTTLRRSTSVTTPAGLSRYPHGQYNMGQATVLESGGGLQTRYPPSNASPSVEMGLSVHPAYSVGYLPSHSMTTTQIAQSPIASAPVSPLSNNLGAAQTAIVGNAPSPSLGERPSSPRRYPIILPPLPEMDRTAISRKHGVCYDLTTSQGRLLLPGLHQQLDSSRSSAKTLGPIEFDRKISLACSSPASYPSPGLRHLSSSSSFATIRSAASTELSRVDDDDENLTFSDEFMDLDEEGATVDRQKAANARSLGRRFTDRSPPLVARRRASMSKTPSGAMLRRPKARSHTLSGVSSAQAIQQLSNQLSSIKAFSESNDSEGQHQDSQKSNSRDEQHIIVIDQPNESDSYEAASSSMTIDAHTQSSSDQSHRLEQRTLRRKGKMSIGDLLGRPAGDLTLPPIHTRLSHPSALDRPASLTDPLRELSEAASLIPHSPDSAEEERPSRLPSLAELKLVIPRQMIEEEEEAGERDGKSTH